MKFRFPLTIREQSLLKAAESLGPDASVKELSQASGVNRAYVHELRRRLISFGAWPQSPQQETKP